MPCLRGAVGLLPVAGPAFGALDALWHGDYPGMAFELLGLASDLCSAGVGPGSALKAAGTAKRAVAVVRRVGVRAAAAKVTGLAVHGSRAVLKSHLKRKAKNRVRVAGVKMGLAAAGLLVERGIARRRAAADGPLSTRNEGSGRAERRLAGTFAEVSSGEERLHAALASAVYDPPESRTGVSATLQTGAAAPEPHWYTYVGGDDYRGFWYSPGPRHLVLAERGTTLDADDLHRDLCIAAGLGLASVSGRARCSREALEEQVRSHDCGRITLAGHSLGGAVAAYLTCTLSAGLSVSAAHIFNPGGIPDLTRCVGCAWASREIFVHRILGDPVSVGFLPFRQKTYSEKPGLESSPHRMVHFL